MNASVNRVLLLGNLTRDPEVRYLPTGQANATLRMATTRRFKTQKGEDKEETCFVDVVVWGKQAEVCGQYLSKGSPLFVEGRLQYDEWEKDGQKRNCLRIVAEHTQFVGSPSRRTTDSNGRQGAPEKVPTHKTEDPVADQMSTPSRFAEPTAEPAPTSAAEPAPSTVPSTIPAQSAESGMPDEDNLPF